MLKFGCFTWLFRRICDYEIMAMKEVTLRFIDEDITVLNHIFLQYACVNYVNMSLITLHVKFARYLQL